MIGVQSCKHFGCQRSQPTILGFRHPSGALEDGARGRDFFSVSLYVLGIQSKCYIKIKAKPLDREM